MVQFNMVMSISDKHFKLRNLILRTLKPKLALAWQTLAIFINKWSNFNRSLERVSYYLRMEILSLIIPDIIYTFN